MKLLFTLLFTFFCLISHARVIYGRVLSENDSTQLSGAICNLQSENNTLESDTTDVSGIFMFDTPVKTKLTIEISKEGFSPTGIFIEEGSKTIDLGAIYLNEGISLQEVVVTEDEVINANGKTIVYPSQADVKASSTALSLFQKLPLAGLDVNPIFRTMSVDGGKPKILINGIPSTLEELQGIQAKDIAKVEFSRITPIRYASQGFNGFISVTLKKRNDGGSVYLWGQSALNTTFMDGNFNFTYHEGPSKFTLGYSPSWRNYQDVFDNTWESLIAPDYTINLESHDVNPFNYHYHSLNLKYDFIPNTRTLFSATLRAMPMYNNRRTTGEEINSATGDYSFENKTKNDNFNPSLDLFFRYDFNDRNSLEIEETGTLINSKYRYTSIYDFDGHDEEYSMDANSKRSSLISQINYVHNFNEKSSITAGYQNTYSYSRNTYLTSDYRPLLKENNNNLYASFSQSVGKIYISLSSGMKLFWIENDMNKRHYIRNVTSAYISWNISKKWNLLGSFNYVPGIPSLSEITDYEQQKSPYIVVNGNPNLKASKTLNYYLAPSFQLKKFNATLSLSYHFTTNPVINETYYLGDGLFMQQSHNIHNSKKANASLNLRLNDIAGFGANLNLGFGHYSSNGADWSYKLNSFSGYFTLWWNKGPFTVTYWRTIPGKYLSGYYVTKGENGDALSFRYNPNKHWNIEAGWWYMFERKGTKYPQWSYSDVNPYFKERYIRNNGNMIVLSVSYNADFGSIFRSGRRTLNNSDNSSSLFTI